MVEQSPSQEGDGAAKRVAAAIYDLAPIGIAIYDAGGRLLETNAKCRELFGTSDIAGFVGEDLLAAPELSIERRAALREGRAVSYDTLYDFDRAKAQRPGFTGKSGTIHVNLVMAPVRARPDEPVSNYIVLIHDITQRKLAELALRDSEERFRKVFADGSFGMVIVDRQFRFARANAAFCAFIGYSEDELHGLTFRDITHPEHLSADVGGVNKVLAGELAAYKTEKRYIRKDGNVVWGAANISVVRDDHGEFLYFLTIVEDITERKRAERELSETTERLALATSSGRLGVWDWNVPEDAMVWDDRMLQLYGLRREQFRPCVATWQNALHPDDKPRALAECQQALDGVKSLNTEFRVVHPSGQVVHIKADGIVIRDGQGRPARMIGINADISERKRTEEALQNTQRLESLGLLAGGIAHDFNNLLTGIFGYAELACEASRDDKVVQYLSSTLATIDRARALTGQLLTFAKGGAPVCRNAPLFPFVQETVHFALSGSNVSCHFDVSPDLWRCNYDNNQIGQVIDNLVINAQQAMPLGGAIELRAHNHVIRDGQHPSLPAGSYVRLSLRDHGIGIPPESLSRVFDPFFTTKPKGHGLGLATCYSIVKRHGGCIEVESELGKGTTFHVTLPAAAKLSDSEPDAKAAGHRGKGTFLVMDDEEVVRTVASQMLQSCGYTVVALGDGQSALDFFQRERGAGRAVAGMLLDLTISGGVGGEEAVRTIRQLDTDVPVFVASGYADHPVMADPCAYGFTASICKPFRRAQLEDLLAKHLATPG